MKDFYKYPRTFHLPWSLGSTNDDKFLESVEPFIGMPLVITEKMDGENTNMYPDRYHARSIDSKDHPSRHWVKSIWGNIKHEIPEEWRICGENLYAKHSIFYENLESYFMVFGIYDEYNVCLGWEDTEDICKSLGLITVPVIARNVIFNEKELRELADKVDIEKSEGYVIRRYDEFQYDDFIKNVAKWVRPKHVTTDQHWMYQKIVPNQLKNK